MDARAIQSSLLYYGQRFKHMVTVEAVKLLTPQMWRTSGTIDRAVQVILVKCASYRVYYLFLNPQAHSRLAQQQTKLFKPLNYFSLDLKLSLCSECCMLSSGWLLHTRLWRWNRQRVPKLWQMPVNHPEESIQHIYLPEIGVFELLARAQSGPGRYSDWLRAGRSGDRIPVGARFFAHVQTGPGAHPASCIMGTGSFPGVKRPGRGANHPPPPSAEVENE
jgi:hypothetical protein